ncbi:MAG: cephalosporin hydroxylase family protein [Pirellulales bacterium]|nr:cephalosporin hydroxylase family protein [Pirellulales bacterium]
MNPIEAFQREVAQNIAGLRADEDLGELSRTWIERTTPHKYTYNFTWLGRPIIQFPQDIVAVQEIVWRVKPQLIIETGIAHGGSLILSASLLELLGGDGRVLGIDIEIRPHNRREIEAHPLARRIDLIEGSSTDPAIVKQVHAMAAGKGPVLVMLDSNHTHEHVLAEMRCYSPLVTKDSYLIVFDTIIEDMPEDFFPDRPWGRGDNPRTAVHEFLKENDRFEIDHETQGKLLISVAPEGYLRCIAD